MTTAGSTFRTAEPDLTKLLEQIHAGDVQLPDFQRGWVWDDDHIRSLIASISKSYPIGSVMLFETGGQGVRFKPRPVQGAPVNGAEPQFLILDGQQRMTSLYLALKSSEPVPTRTEKGKEIQRVYYLHIPRALDPEMDREEAVVSVPPDRMIKRNFNRDVVLDLSTREKEYEQGYFPLAILFDLSASQQWRREYQRFHRGKDEKLDAYDDFEASVLQRIQRYRVPTIELTRDTEKEAVCQVFEKVNTGGVALTVFELVTATFAADEFNLRENWSERKERLGERPVLSSIESTDFLQAVTLLASHERSKREKTPVGCKRRDILNLSLDAYRENEQRIEEGLEAAARLLVGEKVFDARNVPYKSQLVPLSAICAVLGSRFESDAVRQKLARWYWCGVFGELYGGTTETRFANDVGDVIGWIEGGPEPRTVRDAGFAPTRLLTLQTRLSAAYKGMMGLLMKEGSRDFINGDTIEVTAYFDQSVDIHHVFPRSYCQKQGLPKQLWNSIANKAPLTARTNRIIGGHAPSKYLGRIENGHGVSSDRLDEILKTHLIDPEHLRSDAFARFIHQRSARLLDMIEKATGRRVLGRDTDEVVSAFGAPLSPSTVEMSQRTEPAVE